jgi:threonine 3-dehydrogenase
MELGKMKKALITGGNGNIGRLLAERLVAKGIEVIRFDLPGSEPDRHDALETIITGDIRDQSLIGSIFDSHKPDAVYHLASLLSGSSEADVNAAWEINATASFNLLQLGKAHDVGMFFFASTLASYGRDIPSPMPENHPQWPENIYGVTKIAVERLGNYFKAKHGMDFRCLRFPLVISPFAPPAAVTAFPSHAFKAAIDGKAFTFPVNADTGLSTLFLLDVINSIMAFTFAEREQVRQAAYNVHAYSLSAQDVIDEIVKRHPDFQYSFEPQETVQNLIGGWPDATIDASAREDWGWSPEYDFTKSADWMFDYYKA